MNPVRRWRLRREHRWFLTNRARLLGGYTPQFTSVPGDPFVLGVLALAESEHLQQMLRSTGGSVAAMLSNMSGPDRDLLAAQVADIRDRTCAGREGQPWSAATQPR